MYDAIVIGARVAGAPTAMLLARKGYRVLLVDSATFPSDMLSTHQIQIPGSLLLKRWGLYDKVMETKPGVAAHVRFDIGGGEIVLDGNFPEVDGVKGVHSPRRYMLDKVLVDAAVAAGAELREAFTADELILEDDKVVGIKGRSQSGGEFSERAKIVIGADGSNSLVAKKVSAPVYNASDPVACAYYTYWENLPMNGAEIYEFKGWKHEKLGRRVIGSFPTNNQHIMIMVSFPSAQFKEVSANVEAKYLEAIDRSPSLSERVRQAKQVEKFRGRLTPNFYRKPYGPGWALVGDAGYTKDPITGLGITDAFRDAELLAEAIDAGFSGKKPIEHGMAEYEKARNEASKVAYMFTKQVAEMIPPTPDQVALFTAISHNPEAATQFFGVITGVVDATQFFSPMNIMKMLGMGGGPPGAQPS